MAQTRIAGEVTDARETVERRWFGVIERDADCADLVTAKDARREPFHRWMVFKQAFSPELVREFLNVAVVSDGGRARPLLDPFSGTGTFVTECARQNVAAVGIEALASPAYVTNAKFANEVPDPPDISGCEDWRAIAARLTEPTHRAALICAVAGMTTAKGTINKNAVPVADAFREMVDIMQTDVRNPPARRNLMVRGDGGDVRIIASNSVGGVLTSPPYLSRHDYARITRPAEEVLAYWNPQPEAPLLPAHGRAKGRGRRGDVAPAVTEACEALRLVGQDKWAGVTRAYFQEMSLWLKGLRRVLRPGAPCWIVIGAARIKDVYIPSDTILADAAVEAGFSIERMVAARNLVPTGRKFGRLNNVAPRESILMTRCT